MIDKNVIQYLEDLGLSETEATLYLGLLEMGETTVLELARHTNLKRATTHFNVESLIKKGLVSQTAEGSRRKIMPEDPSTLKTFISKKKEKIESLENQFDKVIESVSFNPSVNKEKVQIRFYEGVGGVEMIYREAFEASELRSYVNLEEVHKTFKNNSKIYLEAIEDGHPRRVREITDRSRGSIEKAIEFSQDPNFEVKVTTISLNLSAIDILMFEDKVAMINFKDQITGSVLTDRNYYENSIGIFDYLWESLPDANLQKMLEDLE